MNRLNDEELDKALRDTLHGQLDEVLLKKDFEQKVLERIVNKESRISQEVQKLQPQLQKRSRKGKWAAFTLGSQRVIGLSIGAVAMLIGLVILGVLRPERSLPLSSASHSADSKIGVLRATLAPIAVENVEVISGAAPLEQSGANQEAHGQAQKIVALSKQLLTVQAQLYNASGLPISGKDLQGMLFVLRQPSELSPVQESDWEYFVNGPNDMILPHRSVSWSFTLNPTPTFAHLRNHTVHLVWFLRHTNNAFPSLTMGTLPISTSDIRESVIGMGGANVQFLRITARLTNRGVVPWNPRSALAMLFFDRQAGVALFSRKTYKYFDDVTPLAGSSTSLAPGQSMTATFDIVGVPDTDMRQLPLHILLVARDQVGA
ncbi:hypothetical protein [Sulfoacidibacillus thermotolerans]|uniref:Uncharacterized protein n=1 Tax=Sulfoacidibacillus thermotolerans TaxID=1765684 RepID=A0A2U3D5U9_SULT2|nr:hypothetical protein [Sulfoacidibacillus thermotolerans]PWI56652.1 hypothetical protein BM613_12540 [Sulfoacidibacillus thermotolerans]